MSGFLMLYLIWIQATHVLAIALFTYYVSSAPGEVAVAHGVSRLQEINDLYQSSSLYLAAGVAFGFLLLTRALYPLTSLASLRAFVTWGRLRSGFLPGAFRGIAVALAFLVAFLLSGYYKITGVWVQLDEAWLSTLTLCLKTLALLLMVYSEEYLFRRKMMEWAQQAMGKEAGMVAVALSYALVKAVQFDLGLMQFGSLLLVSFILSLQSSFQRDFTFGAGQWTGCLWVFHLFFGLPVFGMMHSGFFSLQYLGPTLDVDWATHLKRLLTGGYGGPLSSLAFQFLLALYLTLAVAHRYRRLRKFRLNAEPAAQ
jgi:hypothetical protein